MFSESKTVLWIIIHFLLATKDVQSLALNLDQVAVDNFREYLRIESVHPNVNYTPCISFLRKQAQSLNLPIKVIELAPNKPQAVITWKGTEPEKPSILLSGHMDVVPVFPDKWKHSPFGAEMDAEGNIYARGAQDMKSVSIQHIEAIRRLKLGGIRLKRTVHLHFAPDEEIGGKFGMGVFVKSQEFKNLNVGFALDEGGISENNKIIVTYAEKSPYQLWINCPGDTGHGSTLFNNTAGDKLRSIIDRFMDYRASEKAKLIDPRVKAGNVTSINLTMLKGGLQMNVVPGELSAAFDIRIPPDLKIYRTFEEMIQKWLEDVGCEVDASTKNHSVPIKGTRLDDSNVYWKPFREACLKSGVEIDLSIAPWGTDANSLRAIGIPALGFSPINNTPPLLHSHNEYLNKDVFLKGIVIFMDIITAIANV
ncbi:aminoacylase-1-like isoform X1 [Leptopilina heterotoma]|uniref:aminoacylase-1-like isoform X1 n=1 Tax=Leptopilina heterotoma TaxID=63436 RepID=UPI001CA7CFAC|nr:aminoacylase-1-like isoform X1 [Leptopilina heterotoma]